MKAFELALNIAELIFYAAVILYLARRRKK